MKIFIYLVSLVYELEDNSSLKDIYAPALDSGATVLFNAVYQVIN